MRGKYKSIALFTVFLFFLSFINLSCSSKKKYTYYTYEEPKYYKSGKYKLKIPYNSKVKSYIRYYTRKDSKFIKNALERANLYLPTIKKIFKQYGLPEDLAYLPIIESGFNPYARSSSGAVGLWQFLPQTARRFGLTINRYIDERKDPYKSTIAAAKYLKYLYSIFKDWELVLASYNCGEGCIQRKLRSSKKSYWHIRHKLPEQTREYVPKFFAVLIIAKNPAKYGIYVRKRPIYIVRKHAKVKFHLKKLARRYRLDYQTLKLLNAHLQREIALKGVGINLPSKRFVYEKQNMTKPIVKKVSLRYKTYKVKEGDTLYRISKRFGTSVEKLMKFNNLKDYSIKVGQILKIPVE